MHVQRKTVTHVAQDAAVPRRGNIIRLGNAQIFFDSLQGKKDFFCLHSRDTARRHRHDVRRGL